ncbi:MAG: hypothetical protein GEU78_02135 [Actinobacteria bacterium]|nr:hypothetical protein [Actinomycetota bacterium]
MALAAGDVDPCALPTGCPEIEAPAQVVEAVDEVGEGAGELLNEVEKAAQEATGGGTDPVTNPVVGLENPLDLTSGQPGPVAANGNEERDRSPRDRGAGSRDYSERAAAVAAYQRTVDMMAAREARRAPAGPFDRAVSFVSTPPGLVERLTQAAVEAAKTFAFPAILIGLVAGFVLVQNRIDRADPKLVFAPVSSEQDYLSFN